MTDELTPLDHAHAAMEAAPDNATARMRFYERLADAELFLLLTSEPDGDRIEPATYDLPDGPCVLVFDRELRLAAFAEGSAPYVALSGRVLAGMLAGQGIGLGLNLGVAPSAFLMPAEAVDWLAETLASAPEEVEARPTELTPPAGLPEALLESLDTKLALAAGLAHSAYLAGVTYEQGQRSHLLAFIDPVPGAEPSLARAANEALTFSEIEAGAIDVGFFAASDPMAARLARVGLRFDLPTPEPVAGPGAPGMDPDKPPRLR